jgi:hypothetical protein
MSDNKLRITGDVAGVAAYNLVTTLMVLLMKGGKLTQAEADFIGASAASMCEVQGSEMAANLIKSTIPSTASINVVEAAKSLGFEIIPDEG